MSPEVNKPSPRDLRMFSVIVAVGAVLVAWLWGCGRLPVVAGAAAAFAGLGLLLPGAVAWPYRGWMLLGLAIGWVSVRVVLFLIYALIFTPMALVFRLMGRDALKRRRGGLASYWEPYDAQPTTLERYRRLF